MSLTLERPVLFNSHRQYKKITKTYAQPEILLIYLGFLFLNLEFDFPYLLITSLALIATHPTKNA